MEMSSGDLTNAMRPSRGGHFISRRFEEHIGEPPFLVLITVHLLEPELIAIKLQRPFEIFHANHCVKVMHTIHLKTKGPLTIFWLRSGRGCSAGCLCVFAVRTIALGQRLPVLWTRYRLTGARFFCSTPTPARANVVFHTSIIVHPTCSPCTSIDQSGGELEPVSERA